METETTAQIRREEYTSPDMSIVRFQTRDMITASTPITPPINPSESDYWGDNDAEPDMG